MTPFLRNLFVIARRDFLAIVATPTFLLFLLALWSSPGVLAQALPELELKATYAYNFAALTLWPAAARTTFNFCAYGDEGVAEAMRRLEGKTLHGRSVTVARLRSLSAIRDCDLLYVGANEASSLPQIAASTQRAATYPPTLVSASCQMVSTTTWVRGGNSSATQRRSRGRSAVR